MSVPTIGIRMGQVQLFLLRCDLLGGGFFLGLSFLGLFRHCVFLRDKLGNTFVCVLHYSGQLGAFFVFFHLLGEEPQSYVGLQFIFYY